MGTLLQAAPGSPAEEVSSDPQVLQIEIFPPPSGRLQMGPDQIFGMIDDRLAIVTQLKPTSNKTWKGKWDGNEATSSL